MTIRETKKWLFRVRDIIKSERRIIDQMAMLESRQFQTTRSLSGMPRGSTPFTVEDYVIGMEDLQKKLLADLKRERKAYEEILRALNHLDGLIRESLIMYYLMMMTWEEIAVKLDKSYRQVQNYHKAGIEKISKIL